MVAIFNYSSYLHQSLGRQLGQLLPRRLARPGAAGRRARDAGDGRVVHLRRLKKSPAYVVTVVERQTRCVVAWAVCESRTPEVMQSVVDAAPHARNYYSDAFNTYRELCWWGEHRAMYYKSQT
jgi:hypothetical protein